jgi:AraC-like DNA-binding protein
MQILPYDTQNIHRYKYKKIKIVVKPMEEIQYIKNMVCPRCIMAVSGILNELNIEFKEIELGSVCFTNPISKDLSNKLSEKLSQLGFELLEPGKSGLIARVKAAIVEQVHYSSKPLKENFSSYLAEKLHHDYSYLSRLFSSVEGITIEKFIAKQKIERVKELIFYDELTLSEIAFKMDYSSVAYLSTQFKKETGMTPTEFKNTHQPGHRHLDSL